MTLPKFKYLAPSDVKEASAALNEHNGRIAVLAGGTELVTHLKWQVKTPDYLLSLKNLLDLKTIKYDQHSGFTIGAMVSLRNLAANTTIRSEVAALAQAVEGVATPQIRNMATIGGNVCLDTRCWYYDRSKQWRITSSPCYKVGGDQCYVVKGGRQCYALFQADTVPSLLILRAKLKLVHFAGERIIPIEEFYAGLGKTPNQMSSDEILTEIYIPELSSYTGTAYFKYSKRSSFNFSILGLASLVKLDRGGRYCQEARFGLIGHDSKPHVIEATEPLTGLDKPVLTQDMIDRILQEVKPVPHMGISASLKRRIARVLLQKAFLDSWKIAQKS